MSSSTMSIRNGHARWAFDLSAWRPSRADLMLATACIQSEEKERLAKFVFRNDFDASLVGRLLMRKFVNDSTPQAYGHISLGRDARGRPQLLSADGVCSAGERALDFNVSHQGDFSVLAGVMGSEHTSRIGVDIMKLEYTGGKLLSEFFRLMSRNFTAGEWLNIRGERSQASEAAQTRSFMRHWCLKESYVKNTGVGITIDLQSIEFAVRTPQLRLGDRPVTDTTLSVSGTPLIGWTFEESLLDDTHSVCVAVRHDQHAPDSSAAAAAPSFDIIGFDELMKGAEPLLEADYEYCTAVLNKEYKTIYP